MIGVRVTGRPSDESVNHGVGRQPTPECRLGLPKRPRHLKAHEMIDAVVASLETPVFHVTHQVLGEERIAVPEAIGEVDAAAEALLLRAREIEGRAADDRAVGLDAQHQIGGESSGDAGEEIATVRADEVRDDMAASPVAADKVVVNERLGRRPRVFDPGVQPVLPEEPEKVHAPHAADGDSLREKIRGQEMADATARAALAAGVVPEELAVEPEVAAREKVAIEVAEAQLAV